MSVSDDDLRTAYHLGLSHGRAEAEDRRLLWQAEILDELAGWSLRREAGTGMVSARELEMRATQLRAIAKEVVGLSPDDRELHLVEDEDQ
jgi:hypothetical protein